MALGTVFALGVVMQLLYARLVNVELDALGLDSVDRARLRNDRGLVSPSVTVVGMFARACFAASVLFPLLDATGLFRAVIEPGS